MFIKKSIVEINYLNYGIQRENCTYFGTHWCIVELTPCLVQFKLSYTTYTSLVYCIIKIVLFQIMFNIFFCKTMTFLSFKMCHLQVKCVTCDKALCIVTRGSRIREYCVYISIWMVNEIIFTESGMDPGFRRVGKDPYK